MSNFINMVQFEIGDKVSLISFAETVHSEIAFSSDYNLLSRAISNLTTGNLTALYDALYVAVNQTAMESGAKCIVAFTVTFIQLTQ